MIMLSLSVVCLNFVKATKFASFLIFRQILSLILAFIMSKAFWSKLESLKKEYLCSLNTHSSPKIQTGMFSYKKERKTQKISKLVLRFSDLDPKETTLKLIRCRSVLNSSNMFWTVLLHQQQSFTMFFLDLNTSTTKQRFLDQILRRKNLAISKRKWVWFGWARRLCINKAIQSKLINLPLDGGKNRGKVS